MKKSTQEIVQRTCGRGSDEGLFAESGTGSRSLGFFGSGGSQGIAQLGMGSGQQLESLAGLKEGLERLGC